MRFLTALTFASGALALATGPIQHPADQQTVQGDALLSPENAVLTTPGITSQDETVSSSEVEKRTPGTSASVRLPTNPDSGALPITIAGIVISFVMSKRWIERNGERVLEWFVQHVIFRNQNPVRTIVEATANGLSLFNMRMAQNVQMYGEDPPAGADFFTLVVRPLNDEL
ncbi:hypothetical protein E4U60_007812 [Claviceps pazoutovae]|uniref:Uncharacterized protein n=1 Tax=Claviceps pazoutovae TaxID=1649127 RepID=A0A9P7M2N9_9HYPO|nr:hypothetical protein E4U60_007812 [Claviceps pazoutovae]